MTTTKANINPGGTDTYIAESTAPGGNLTVHLKWGRLRRSKNLAIRVTTPQGWIVESDTDYSAAETLTLYGAIVGTYTIAIVNKGTKKTRYTLTYGFGG